MHLQADPAGKIRPEPVPLRCAERVEIDPDRDDGRIMVEPIAPGHEYLFWVGLAMTVLRTLRRLVPERSNLPSAVACAPRGQP